MAASFGQEESEVREQRTENRAQSTEHRDHHSPLGYSLPLLPGLPQRIPDSCGLFSVLCPLSSVLCPLFSVLCPLSPHGRGIIRMHTGVGASTTVPVGFSSPVFGSMRNTTMLF